MPDQSSTSAMSTSPDRSSPRLSEVSACRSSSAMALWRRSRRATGGARATAALG
ncbi:MAG TPA: hypothetical protein VE172_15325 [Stackebrandtia sp.]|nr:hypothetical protein [Stackebrandtia sp.]HZE40176.1 hypothetical protein [Stackebrandtia sp.]